MEFGGPGLARRSRRTSAPPSPTWRPSARRRPASSRATSRLRAGSPSGGRMRTRSDCAARVRRPRPGRRVRGRRPHDRPRGDRARWSRPRRSRPDPANGAFVATSARCAIDIAYGGSCTAGKERGPRHVRAGDAARPSTRGRARAPTACDFFIQFGSRERRATTRATKGYLDVFAARRRRGHQPRLRRLHRLRPRRLGDLGAGHRVSAINRNFAGRSGPGKLYLASPLTVAACAIEGRIVAYKPGMFRQPVGAR